MTDEEMKNKYSAFISEISEILGLGKPIDILKLCATTDLFFQPLEKRIAELEEEIAELKAYNEKLLDGDIEKHNKIVELKSIADFQTSSNMDRYFQLKRSKEHLTKAKEIIKRLLKATYGEGWNYSLQVKVEAEKFLKESE